MEIEEFRQTFGVKTNTRPKKLKEIEFYCSNCKEIREPSWFIKGDRNCWKCRVEPIIKPFLERESIRTEMERYIGI